jgi:ribosomal protein S18 acetylase RimI-like enzyme
VISLKIKKANEEDIKAVAKVYIDGWRTTYRGLVSDDYLDGLSYEEAEQRWFHFLNNENESFIYIAINDTGKIIGFAAGKSIEDEHFKGELYALYLLEECRGLGVGRQLISAIAKHFKEKNITSMMVWVMEQNKSGLGFYERMGGKKYLRRKSEFGGMEVDDVAYGWGDVSVLCMEDEHFILTNLN